MVEEGAAAEAEDCARAVRQPANRRWTGDEDKVGADCGGWGRAEGAGGRG